VSNILATNLLDLDTIADYDKRTPLHMAVANGHFSCVDLLMRHGANPLKPDRWGQSALEEAQYAGASELVNRLQQSDGMFSLKVDPGGSKFLGHSSSCNDVLVVCSQVL
jgi:ankyrin repeat protein